MKAPQTLAILLGLCGCGSKGLPAGQGDARPEVDAAEPDAPVADAAVVADARAADSASAGDAASAADTATADARGDAAAAEAPVAEAGGPDANATDAATDAMADAALTPVTITYLQHDSPAFLKAQDQAFARYTAAHPEVTVAPTAQSWQAYTGALAADLTRDQLPYDLVLLPPSATCTYAANLDDVPAGVISLGEAQQTFFTAPLEGSVCGGKLKALPVEYNLEYGGVVVNLDLYQAKFPNRQPQWTDWASFLAEASALTRFDAGKPCRNGLDIDPEWPEPVRHIFLGQIVQRGGRYWSSTDPRLFDFSTREAHEALAEMVAWVTRDKVLSTALFPDHNSFVTVRLSRGASGYGCGDDVSQPLSVMGYLGTWGLDATIAERPPGSQTRFAYAALPPMVGTQHTFVQNAGYALAVPRTSKNRRAAWDLAKAVALSPEGMRKWAATAGTLPALRVNGTPTAAANDPLLARIQPLLERGRWTGQIPYGATQAVLGAMVSNYYAAVRGTKTIDQALADMQTTANQAIAQNQ